MVVGLARDLLRPLIYEGLASCLLGPWGGGPGSSSSTVSSFMNLGGAIIGEESASHNYRGNGSNGGHDVAIRPVLLSLRPRFVTLGEPDAPTHLQQTDSRCGGCAWPPDMMFPWQRQLQIFDRYRRALELVEAAEREDDALFGFVVRVRPDLYLLRPVPPWCPLTASVFYGPDYLVVAPRRAARALYESIMAYWSCNFSKWSLRGRRPEEWESQVYQEAGMPPNIPAGGISWLCIHAAGGHPAPGLCNAARSKNLTCRAPGTKTT
eukprot:2322986-Prymnesium_polylepis.1